MYIDLVGLVVVVLRKLGETPVRAHEEQAIANGIFATTTWAEKCALVRPRELWRTTRGTLKDRRQEQVAKPFLWARRSATNCRHRLVAVLELIGLVEMLLLMSILISSVHVDGNVSWRQIVVNGAFRAATLVSMMHFNGLATSCQVVR